MNPTRHRPVMLPVLWIDCVSVGNLEHLFRQIVIERATTEATVLIEALDNRNEEIQVVINQFQLFTSTHSVV